MSLLLGALVFIAAAALDYAMVRYQEAVTARQGHHAACWSIGVYLVGSVGFLSVVRGSLWYMVPECLGLYLGTRLAVRRPARPVPDDVASPVPSAIIEP